MNVLQTWLHGRINAAIVARLNRLEQKRSDADAVIRGQARMIEQMQTRLSELEDRAVEGTPDGQLEGFAERVRDIIADYIDNDDQLMTRHVFDEMVEAFINESVFKIKVR